MSNLKNSMSSSGRLDIMIGSMFSRKTTSLINELLICADLGLNVLYINHTFDNRSESHAFSPHHPFIVPKNYENIEFVSLESLKGVRKEDYDVIGIDEAQFFDESLIEFCKIHVETYKIHVIVTGLDSDFKREKFGHIIDLIPIADNITKLKSYCRDCGPKKVEAIFSYKCSSNSKGQIDVGGKDKYKPLCRNCYLNYN